MIGHGGQASEHIFEIGVGIDLAATTVFYDAIDDVVRSRKFIAIRVVTLMSAPIVNTFVS